MPDAPPCPCLEGDGEVWWSARADLAHAADLAARGLVVRWLPTDRLKVWRLLRAAEHRTYAHVHALDVGWLKSLPLVERQRFRQTWVPAWCVSPGVEGWLEARWRDRVLTPARLQRLHDRFSAPGEAEALASAYLLADGVTFQFREWLDDVLRDVAGRRAA